MSRHSGGMQCSAQCVTLLVVAPHMAINMATKLTQIHGPHSTWHVTNGFPARQCALAATCRAQTAVIAENTTQHSRVSSKSTPTHRMTHRILASWHVKVAQSL